MNLKYNAFINAFILFDAKNLLSGCFDKYTSHTKQNVSSSISLSFFFICSCCCCSGFFSCIFFQYNNVCDNHWLRKTPKLLKYKIIASRSNEGLNGAKTNSEDTMKKQSYRDAVSMCSTGILFIHENRSNVQVFNITGAMFWNVDKRNKRFRKKHIKEETILKFCTDAAQYLIDFLNNTISLCDTRIKSLSSVSFSKKSWSIWQ